MGRGKRLSRDEMKDLIISLDKKGLMHTGNKNWKTMGLGLLCSCCTCCCYPFRAGIELELKGLWPKSYYIAEYNPKECTYCGLCVRRCRFGAWEHDGTSVEVRGKKRKNVIYDPEKCWGCGLCATTCAPDAIIMKALDVPISSQSEESHVH